MALVLVWLLSWSPYASVFLANVTGHSAMLTHHLVMLPGTTREVLGVRKICGNIHIHIHI